MGKLEERENRRRASVVGPIVGVEQDSSARRKGRPKEQREIKKRVSLSVLPSLYEDIQKIAFVERRSVSDLMAELMGRYCKQHMDELDEFYKIKK